MNKISAFIIKNRKIVAICFLALAIFSVFSISWVNIEESIEEYLPDSADAKQGLMLMDKEFVTYASGTVFVRNISREDAETLHNTISELDGILQVSFDADSETYYKDSCAKYAVTFSGPADQQIAIDGMNHLKKEVSFYDANVISDSFSNYSDELTSQMASVLGIVAVLVIIILLFTSTTYAEVPVFLITFIAAALINMGTNFLFGTISFVSNAVAVVLQLALSVDYAIILCNRYKEEHATHDIQEAVQLALAHSIPAISASSLTTIAGLAAMTLMHFKLGLDMGMALIKSILISLLTVFLLMPFLLCAFGKWMDKTQHKSFIPKVDFLGKFAFKTRFIVPPLFVALVVFACISYGQVKYDYDGTLVNIINETEDRAANREMTEIFGNDNVVALMVPDGDYKKQSELVDALESYPGIISVTSLVNIEAVDGYCLGDYVNYRQFMKIADLDETSSKALIAYCAAQNGDIDNLDPETYEASILELFNGIYDLMQEGEIELTDEQEDLINELHDQLSMATDQLQGENYVCIAVENSYPVQGNEAYDFLDDIRRLASEYYSSDNVFITGDQVSAEGFYSTFTEDTRIVGILSIVLVMLILLLTYRSIAMPLLLILVIQGSIWINFSLAVWTDSYVFFMCYLIVSSIQMGANIDYAIVISTRYNEMRMNGMSSKDSITRTLNLAFPTVLTSGTMMVVSGALIAIRISDSVIAGMGQYVATGTAVSLILVNFALPQILVLGDKVVQATTLHIHFSSQVKKCLRMISLLLLSFLAVSALILPVFIPAKINSVAAESVETAERMEELSSELLAIADKEEKEDVDTSTAYQYAEFLLTDEIGTEQLNEGQTQYDQGKKELDSAKVELSEGEKEYQQGLTQYEAAQKQLLEGKATYDAGEAQLAQAKKDYAEGEQQLTDARAQYAEGEASLAAGKAEYENGKQQLADAAKQLEEAQATYDAGKAKLDALSPLYSTIYPHYERYLSLKEQFGRIPLVDELYEMEIAGTGYSVKSFMTEYEAGQKELEEGAAQLAEGYAQYDEGQATLDAAAAEISASEQKLADAKVQIDEGQAQLDDAAYQIQEGEKQLADGAAELADGYLQLTDAKKQLDDARKQLDDGYDELNDGQKELDDAKQELEDGKKTLAENAEKLNASIDELISLSDDREKLQVGAELMEKFPEVIEQAGTNPDYNDLFSVAQQYFSKLVEDVRTGAASSILMIWILAGAGLLGLLAVILFFLKKCAASHWLSFSCGCGSLICVILWKWSELYGSLPRIIALCLMITAFLYTIIIVTVNDLRKDPETSSEQL